MITAFPDTNHAPNVPYGCSVNPLNTAGSSPQWRACAPQKITVTERIDVDADGDVLGEWQFIERLAHEALAGHLLVDEICDWTSEMARHRQKPDPEFLFTSSRRVRGIE